MPGGSGTRSALSDEWVPGPDGLPFRRAARVLLLDDQDRLLLVRGHDVDQPERSWWFTVGGGIDAGESDQQAALRELREETGILLGPADLVGPVLTRSAVFDFLARTCRQDEVFYLARVPSGLPLARDGWTAVEAELLDEMRWWPLDELAQVRIEVYPVDVAVLVRSLLTGWDGTVRHLGEQHD
ncbi:MAG TPA: NUDIX domain-containing protein [Cellulomonas sp.]